jgi:hypothetical protein
MRQPASPAQNPEPSIALDPSFRGFIANGSKYGSPQKKSSDSAQKSHVKPQNNLNRCNQTGSSWRISSLVGCLRLVEKSIASAKAGATLFANWT